MWIFIVVAVFCFIFGACRSAIREKPYEEKSIEDVRKFHHDVYDPDISPRQLDRNIREGKYKKTE